MQRNIFLTTICPGEADIQLALYYLKAHFLKHSVRSGSVNITVRAFPSSENVASISSQIDNYSPQIIGFSCYVWNIVNILRVAKLVKEKRKNIKIILGGPEVSPRAYQLLKYNRFIDAVVIGEGEETFKELIEHYLDSSAKIEAVDGIVYCRGHNIVATKRRPEIENLDDIPSPYLEGDIDLKSYNGHLPTETLRGCTYRCHYCYYHKDFQRVRCFSLERVEKELRYLLSKKPKGIYLMDPTFNFIRERAKRILGIFIKYNKRTKLHVELKAELLDKEMIDLLRKAKANFIEIGIQSTNKKTLKLINRSFMPRAFEKNILLLNQKKVPYEVQLIDGLPADTYKGLKQGVDWLLRLRPPMIRIMRLMLLPGTFLRRHAKDFGIIYNPRPPYYTLQSDTFSLADLKKTEELRTAVGILYDDGLLKESLYRLAGKTSVSFSGIFEEWSRWMHKSHRDLFLVIKGHFKQAENVKLRNAIYMAAMVKLAGILKDFVSLFCEKHAVPLDKQLLNSFKRDRRHLLKQLAKTGTSVQRISSEE